MKRIVVILLICVTICSCKSFSTKEQLKVSDRGYENKIIGLEPVFENTTEVKHWKAGDRTVRENSPWATIFYREVEKNVSTPSDRQKGYIVLRPVLHETETGGYGWAVLSGITLLIPNFFGMPMGYSESTAEIELEVLNKRGDTIKKYTASGDSKEYVAMWWGYSSTYNYSKALSGGAITPDVTLAASYASYKKVLSELLEQLMSDSDLINEKLSKQ